MEIIRDDKPYLLTMAELKEAAAEWEHLCRMRRIVKYMADYYDLPLTAETGGLINPAQQDFYEIYQMPFSMVACVYNLPIERLEDCPDQIFMFLSSLAHLYEHDEILSEMPEEEAFNVIFQEKDAQATMKEESAKLMPLGVFVQGHSDFVVGDPSVPNDDQYLCVISNPEAGLWKCAVQIVAGNGDSPSEKVSVLIAKSERCPYSFEQVEEQMFFWGRLPNSVLTMHGVIGLYDRRFYQDPTSFAIPPTRSEGKEKWVESCLDMVMDAPYACVFPHGVVSSSGNGEGSYEVYVLRDTAGVAQAVVVDFLVYGGL